MKSDNQLEPPEDIGAAMPSVGQIITGLEAEIVIIKSVETLYRASWSRNGLFATLWFPRVLTLWSMNGEASSRLGIYDQLPSPYYEWCQQFGTRVHDAMAKIDVDSRPDGLIYPSPRVRDSAAIVLSFEVVSSMHEITLRHERFTDHPVYERQGNDPPHVPPYYLQPREWGFGQLGAA